jgi:predicted ATPase
MATVSIDNIKNIQSLVFDIPAQKGVYVLAGINGTGKSTLLACLARIGNSRAFQDNFRVSGNVAIDMYSGSITYNASGQSVTYSKRGSKWQPSSRRLNVFGQFAYNEVVFFPPTGERLYVQEEVINSRNVTNADQWLIDGMNAIFSTTRFNDLKQIRVAAARGRHARTNTAYLIKKGLNQYYSEKNFSFGEILILNLLLKLHDIHNNSLLLIDEIELALYPKVQINLLNYLQNISQHKSLITIISTHSASLIKNAKHIILLEPSAGGITVSYDCSPAKALGEIAFQEDITQDAIFFVEDKMAKYYLRELLQLGLSLLGKAPDYRVIFVGGFDSVIKLHLQVKGSVLSNKTKLISFLDADVNEDSIPHYRTYEPLCDFIQTYNTIDREVKFLPTTPEVGMIDYLQNNAATVSRALANHFGVHAIDLATLYNTPDYVSQNAIVTTKKADNTSIDAKARPLSRADSTKRIENNGAIRKACKEKFQLVLNYLLPITIESEESITKFLFKNFVQYSFSSKAQQNTLKGLFGPIFN